jgi:4,5-dihydroxyphthalate decarboxylase
MIFNNVGTMLPWVNELVETDVSVMGHDWWPSGLKANRKAIDSFLRYHYEQGLSKRHLTCEDIFVPEFLET